MKKKKKNMLKMLVKIAITCLIILFIVFIINNFRKEHFQDKECTGTEEQKEVCCSNHFQDNPGMKTAILNTDGTCELKDVEECPVGSKQIINVDVGESDVDLFEPLTCDELKDFIKTRFGENSESSEVYLEPNPPPLVQVLEDCSRLIILYTRITDKGVELAEALTGNNTLTSLSLSNNIDDKGAIALAGALTGNNTLTRLTLNSNNIGDEGAIALADALKGNTTLTRLSLNHNNIGDTGVSALADALKVNNTLTHLFIQKNNIGQMGKDAVKEARNTNNNDVKIYI